MSRDKTRIRSIIRSMKREGYSFWDLYLTYNDIQTNKPHRVAKVKRHIKEQRENRL